VAELPPVNLYEPWPNDRALQWDEAALAPGATRQRK
jgi:hypothetical protein